MGTAQQHLVNGLPDFFVIGAMKSGTTEFFRLLSQHPDVLRSRNKEPNFFVNENSGTSSGTWHRGLTWYKNLFPEGVGLRGEASTRYTRFPTYAGVVDRIHRTIPDPRFLYILRHPVDRAISQFLYSTLKGTEQRAIAEALAPSSTSSYVTTGLYHMQLSVYLLRFRKGQFHILLSDDLWARPHETMNKVFEFLAIRPFGVDLAKKNGKNSISQLVNKLRCGDQEIISRQQEELLRKLDSIPKEHGASSAEVASYLGFGIEERAALSACFREDIRSLEGFMGRRLTEWDRFH